MLPLEKHVAALRPRRRLRVCRSKLLWALGCAWGALVLGNLLNVTSLLGASPFVSAPLPMTQQRSAVTTAASKQGPGESLLRRRRAFWDSVAEPVQPLAAALQPRQPALVASADRQGPFLTSVKHVRHTGPLSGGALAERRLRDTRAANALAALTRPSPALLLQDTRYDDRPRRPDPLLLLRAPYVNHGNDGAENDASGVQLPLLAPSPARPDFGPAGSFLDSPWLAMTEYSAIADVKPMHVHWMAAVYRCVHVAPYATPCL